MKHHLSTAISEDVWSEIELLLLRHSFDSLPRGSVMDGFVPIQIESTNRGLDVRGEIWFLLGGPGSRNPKYELNLCLCRPRFSNISSVTPEKLKTAEVFETALEDGLLRIAVR